MTELVPVKGFSLFLNSKRKNYILEWEEKEMVMFLSYHISKDVPSQKLIPFFFKNLSCGFTFKDLEEGEG